MSNDSFDISFTETDDLVGRNLDPFGSFTGGNFLADLSASISIPLSGPHLIQQTNGQVVAAYRETFPNGTHPPDHDVSWHSTDPNADPLNETPIAGSKTDEILHDATAVAGGGSAAIFETPDSGILSVENLQFVSATGTVIGTPIPVGSHAGQAQLNPSIVGLFNGDVAVTYENFNSVSNDRERANLDRGGRGQGRAANRQGCGLD